MTNDELNEARELVADPKIGLRKAARQLGMNHSTLYRRLKQQQQESTTQRPMEQLVDALERYARANFKRPMMPARNPNWEANCDWIALHIDDFLDSWKLRDD